MFYYCMYTTVNTLKSPFLMKKDSSAKIFKEIIRDKGIIRLLPFRQLGN